MRCPSPPRGLPRKPHADRCKATAGGTLALRSPLGGSFTRAAFGIASTPAPLPALNRRADLVFSRTKVAVFIDGCFWHGCPDHHTVAKANATYWADKVAGNRQRDVDTSERLKDAGWLVLRFWEHQPPSEVAEAIIHAVQERRAVVVHNDRQD